MALSEGLKGFVNFFTKSLTMEVTTKHLWI